jgi:hypothetical protein
MNRYQLLAAEIYGYTLANYQDHLGLGYLRYEKVMPEVARTLERAATEGWSLERVAGELHTDLNGAAAALAALRHAREVIDAPDPAEAFRAAVRHAIQSAVVQGLEDGEAVDHLVTKICCRAADLAFLLECQRQSLTHYSAQLRRKPGGETGKGLFE